MKPWNELTHFAALDWAADHHDVAILDRDGKRIEAFRFEHTAAQSRACYALIPSPSLFIIDRVSPQDHEGGRL